MIYTWVMPWGETLSIRANFAQAGDQIEYECDGEWHLTPWQVADAVHDIDRALDLVTRYLGPDWHACCGDAELMEDDDAHEND